MGLRGIHGLVELALRYYNPTVGGRPFTVTIPAGGATDVNTWPSVMKYKYKYITLTISRLQFRH